MGFKRSVVDEIPSRGKMQSEETKKLLTAVNSAESGKIIKLSFDKKDECYRSYTKLKYFKRQKQVDFKSLARRDNDLYIEK